MDSFNSCTFNDFVNDYTFNKMVHWPKSINKTQSTTSQYFVRHYRAWYFHLCIYWINLLLYCHKCTLMTTEQGAFFRIKRICYISIGHSIILRTEYPNLRCFCSFLQGKRYVRVNVSVRVCQTIAITIKVKRIQNEKNHIWKLRWDQSIW